MSGVVEHRRVSPAYWQLSRKWPDEPRLLGAYLQTCTHRSLEGIFYWPVGYGCADLGWDQQKVAGAVGFLQRAGWLRYDEDAEVVLIVDALKLQRPATKAQIAGALKGLARVPASPLLEDFRQLAAALSPNLAAAIASESAAADSNDAPECDDASHPSGTTDPTPEESPIPPESNGASHPNGMGFPTPKRTGKASQSLRAKHSSASLASARADTAPTPTPTPETSKALPSELGAQARELFEYWQQKCGHPQAKATPDRLAKVKARLREKYTPDDIRRGIDGAARAATVSDDGARRYDDLELICRSGSKLESFMARAQPTAAAAGGPASDERFAKYDVAAGAPAVGGVT